MIAKIKIILLFFLVVGMSQICAQVKFTLTGHIIGRDTGTIFLNYIGISNNMVYDTAIIKGGNFKFEGKIEEPTKAILSGENKTIDFNSVNIVAIFLEPEIMHVELVEDDFQHAKLTGSKTQQENDQLNLKLDSINRKYQNYQQELTKLKYDYVKAKTVSERNAALKKQSAPALTASLNSMSNEIFNSQISFLLNHPDSYVSPQIIYSAANKLPIDSAIKLFNSLTQRIKNSYTGRYMAHYLKIKEQNTIGKKAYNFSAKDINGKTITLSKLKGKYVLLDFWASWCIPCIQLFPQTKDYYKQYHHLGFEVLTVSIDQDSMAWRKSVKEYRLDNWYNIIANDDIKENYPNVTNPIPSAILIGPDGSIVWNSNEEQKLGEVLSIVLKK